MYMWTWSMQCHTNDSALLQQITSNLYEWSCQGTDYWCCAVAVGFCFASSNNKTSLDYYEHIQSQNKEIRRIFCAAFGCKQTSQHTKIGTQLSNLLHWQSIVYIIFDRGLEYRRIFESFYRFALLCFAIHTKSSSYERPTTMNFAMKIMKKKREEKQNYCQFHHTVIFQLNELDVWIL